MSGEEGARESPCAAAPLTAVEPATTTSMTAAGDKETLLFSVRDVSHANRPSSSCVEPCKTQTITKTVSEMTVSSVGLSKSEDSEMVSVDNNSGNSAKKVWNDYDQPQHMMQDEDEDGGRLSEENEAINLCSKDLSQTLQQKPVVATMLSAKMRLKKQRLEAEAAQVSASRSLSSPWSSHESPSPTTTAAAADALHRLAEAAENRKQVSFLNLLSTSSLIRPFYQMRATFFFTLAYSRGLGPLR